MVIDAKIQDFGDIITGKTPSTSNTSYWGCHYPFITPSDYGFNDRYIYTTDRQISIQGANSQKKTILPKNSICITCIGSTIGKICMTVKPSITNQQINSIICNENYDSYYVFYLLKYCIPFLQMYGSGTGSGVPIISKNKFGKIKLTAESSLPLQRRIASILSAYDNLIEANSRRIKILEQMAENLYKEWFVRFRFPNYQNTPIENGIPKGWKVETIDQFCRVFTGKKDVNQTVEDGKYPFFSCSAQDFRSNDYIYEGKAILVAGNGNTGKSKFYDGKFDLYQRTYAIVCESDLIYYLFMRFKTDFEVIYAGGSRGTAIPYIVMKNITKYKFLYNKELIDKFVSIIKPIFSQINTLQLQSANLTRQRDLLLPRLMSGQLTPLTNR